MGDRHGGRFARRGRTLNPSRPQVDAHRGADFRWRATVFRCRGVVGRICPAGVRLRPTCRRTAGRPRPTDSRKNTPSAKASRHGARAKGFAPAQERSPRRKPPDTAHEQKNLPTRERSPRRKPPDTAHERKDLPRAGTRPSAKASRHGAKAKRFAPRRNTPLEGLPTRRTSKRICSAREGSPRRRPPDTARERKDLCRGGSRLPHVPTNGGPPSTDGQPKNTPSAGSHPRGRGRCRVHSPKKNKTTP